MILELYSTILVPVYSEWLNVVELYHLDVAVCNNILRRSFLSQLSLCTLHPPKWVRLHRSIINWVNKRGMKLKGCSVRELDPAHARILSRSKSLEWHCASNVGVLKHVLNKCPKIYSLRLNGDVKEKRFIPLLSRLSELQLMEIVIVRVSEACIMAIAESCPNLRVFRSKVDATLIIQRCSMLSTVKTSLSPQCVNALVQAENVTTISIPDDDVDEGMLMEVVKSKPKLVSLTCKGFNMTDKLLKLLAETCKQLKVLIPSYAKVVIFSYTSHITNTGLNALATQCVQLQELCLSSNMITDMSICVLVKFCPFLLSLKLKNCHCLTDAAAQSILQGLSRLEGLHIFSELFTDLAFSNAFTMCPSLQILHVHSGRLGYSHKITSKTIVSNICDMAVLEVTHRCLVDFIMKKTVKDSNSLQMNFADVAVNFIAWQSIIVLMPSLIKVVFSENNTIDDVIIACVVKNCPLLSVVIIIDCPQVTCCGAVHLLRFCNRLTRLDVVSYLSIAVHGDNKEPYNEYRPSNVTHLKLVNFSMSSLFDRVAALCPIIVSLDLSRSSASSAAISHIIMSCPKLTHINVSGCQLVDASVLQTVVDCVTIFSYKVKIVNVENCRLITTKDADMYASTFNTLRIKLKLKCRNFERLI